MTVQQWQVHAYGPRGEQILGEVLAPDRKRAIAAANARWPGRVLWVTSYAEIEERAALAKVPQTRDPAGGLDPTTWFALGGAAAVVLVVGPDTGPADEAAEPWVWATVGGDGRISYSMHGTFSWEVLGDFEAVTRRDAEAIAAQRFPGQPLSVMSQPEYRAFAAALVAARASALELPAVRGEMHGVVSPSPFIDLEALMRPRDRRGVEITSDEAQPLFGGMA